MITDPKEQQNQLHKIHEKEPPSGSSFLCACIPTGGGVEALIGALAIAGRIGTSVLIAACIAARITSMDTQTLRAKKRG